MSKSSKPMTNRLSRHFATMAYNNAWANTVAKRMRCCRARPSHHPNSTNSSAPTMPRCAPKTLRSSVTPKNDLVAITGVRHAPGAVPCALVRMKGATAIEAEGSVTRRYEGVLMLARV